MLVIYTPTLAPTISWRNGGADSGDLAAAIATWGIPHPPGYPTYILLGQAWIALPLGGDVAYRLNLLSAVAAALAAGLTTATVGLLGRRLTLAGIPLMLGGIIAGLALGLAPLTWSQATITEVYAPGLAILCLMSLCLLWGRYQKRNQTPLCLAGLVGGLGLGVLPQIGLAAPGALVLLYTQKSDYGSWATWFRQVMVPFLAAGGVGLLSFFYLPLRAAAQPWLNWGDPVTPARFWAMVTAAPYHQFIGLLGPAEWFDRLGESIVLLGQQLGWASWGLALPGGYALWREDRAVCGYLLGLTGLTLLFRASYPVVSNVVYLIPALYGPALLAGIGGTWLLTLIQRQIGSLGAALPGLIWLVAFGWRAAGIAPLVDASNDWKADSFGRRILATLPPNSVLISEQDQTTFSLWYRQALGERPDVVIVDSRLLFYDWYRYNLTHHYPELNPTSIRSGNLNNLKQPVYTLVGPPEKAELQAVK